MVLVMVLACLLAVIDLLTCVVVCVVLSMGQGAYVLLPRACKGLAVLLGASGLLTLIVVAS